MHGIAAVCAAEPFLCHASPPLQFEPWDEADDAAAALRVQGVDTTLKLNADVTLEDFKNWGRYGLIVMSSHGDAAEDGSNAFINTGITYTEANAADREQHRIDLNGNEIVLRPSWFTAYSNSMSGAIVYFSACR